MQGLRGRPGKGAVTSSPETLIHAEAMTEICTATLPAMVKANHRHPVPCSLRTFLGWVVVWPVLANVA